MVMIRSASQYLDLAARLIRGQPTGEALIRYQSQRLRRLVHHAYERVPHYRRLFDQHGVKPHDIRGVQDLSKIPITTRRDLQSLPVEQVVARGVDAGRMEVHRTAGSSGEPFTVRRTLAEDRFLFALRLRAFHQMGWRPSDRWAHVASLRPTTARTGFVNSVLKRFGSFRPRGFNCTGPLEEIIPALREYRPDVITGYPNALARLALMLTDDDRRVIRPRLIVSESEVLAPIMREHIRKGFAAPTYEIYASWEFNVLGWECASSGELHTCPDTVLLEILADGRPAAEGERGEVVGTALHSFGMPLIRYRLGDVVTRGRDACACGRSFSTIRAVQGRMLDFFPLPDGRVLHPYEISRHFIYGTSPIVSQYQLTQERKDHMVLRVVPSPSAPPDAFTTLRERLGELLGPRVTINIVVVDGIPSEPSGKYRVARSLVASMYDQSATADERGR